MAGSSPVRRSIQSPDRHRYGSYLSQERNNLNNHHDALNASKEEHDRVRDHAIRALEKHTFQLEQLRIQDEESRILEKQKREKERLEREQRLREEELRLRELEAQKVPKLPPKPVTEAAPATAKPDATGVNGAKEPAQPIVSSVEPAAVRAKPLPTITPSTEPTSGTTRAGNNPAVGQQQGNLPKSNPFATASVAPTPSPFPAAQKSATTPFGQPAAVKQVNGFGAATPVPAATPPSVLVQAIQRPDRYVQIHQSLKKLRATVKQQMTTNVELKKNAGNMRREIRKSIGQLTGERGANKQQVRFEARRIQNLLLTLA